MTILGLIALLTVGEIVTEASSYLIARARFRKLKVRILG